MLQKLSCNPGSAQAFESLSSMTKDFMYFFECMSGKSSHTDSDPPTQSPDEMTGGAAQTSGCDLGPLLVNIYVPSLQLSVGSLMDSPTTSLLLRFHTTAIPRSRSWIPPKRRALRGRRCSPGVGQWDLKGCTLYFRSCFDIVLLRYILNLHLLIDFMWSIF